MQKTILWLLVIGVLIIAAALLGPTSLLAPKDNEDVAPTLSADTTATDSTEQASLPTMLELGSEGCNPCEQMKPIMAQLTEEHGDLIRIRFHDVRQDQAIARQYGIRLIPTQIFLRADGTEFFRHEGFFPKKDIERVFLDMGVPL